MRIFQVMHYDNSEYVQFKEAGRLDDFHNCQYMGYDYFLNQGYEVKWYVPKCRGWFQNFISQRIKLKESVTGLLNVPREAKGYDIVYCPLDNHYFILGILRFLHILKIPVFCISHLSFNTDDTKSKKLKVVIKLGRMIMFRTFDYIAYISPYLLERGQEGFAVPSRYQNAINWGADNMFFNTSKDETNYYVAIGQAKRDFNTLISAFMTMSNVKLKILARGDAVLKNVNLNALPDNIEIIDNPYDVNHWVRMKQIYAGAKATLIPLAGFHHIPCGATVMTESIASATPIIISKTSNNMIDVEKEKIGEEVKCGDIEGWISVIRKLEDNPKILKRYSDNARTLAANTYNYDMFCKKVEVIFKKLTLQTD